MADIQDSRGRAIQLGDWGGGTVGDAQGETDPRIVQGRVVGLEQDQEGWWVILRTPKESLDQRVRSDRVRCHSVEHSAKRGPQRKGWRKLI